MNTNRIRWMATSIAVLLLTISAVGCESPGAPYGYIATRPSVDNAHTAFDAPPQPTPVIITPTPDLLGTQAAAELSADYAQQTAIAARIEADRARVQVTQRAVETEDARRQWEWEQTQTAVAKTQVAEDERATQEALEATRTLHAQRTATAAAEVSASQTAQAVISQTAIAYAIQTAEAMPTRTAEALALQEQIAKSDARVKTAESEQDSAALRHWGNVVLVFLLCALLFVFLLWVSPQAWHSLQVRIASYKHGAGDKPTHFVPSYAQTLPDGRTNPIRALLAPWAGVQTVTTYDQDRDAGPGQRIDLVEGTSTPLTGADPTTTALDQATDMLTRPVLAGGPRVPRRVLKQVAQIPKFRILPPGRKPPQGFILPETEQVLDAEWEEIK